MGKRRRRGYHARLLDASSTPACANRECVYGVRNIPLSDVFLYRWGANPTLQAGVASRLKSQEAWRWDQSGVLACHRSRPRERLGADATLLPSSTHIPMRLCLFLSSSPPPIVDDDWLHRRLRRRILCTLVLRFEDVLPGSCSLEADKVGSFILPPQNWSCSTRFARYPALFLDDARSSGETR